MKKIFSVLLAISLMLSVVSLASAENEKTVNIGVTSTIATLNPLAMDATEIVKYATSLVFQSLVEADSELNFVPQLAESITTEDNLHLHHQPAGRTPCGATAPPSPPRMWNSPWCWAPTPSAPTFPWPCTPSWASAMTA